MSAPTSGHGERQSTLRTDDLRLGQLVELLLRLQQLVRHEDLPLRQNIDQLLANLQNIGRWISRLDDHSPPDVIETAHFTFEDHCNHLDFQLLQIVGQHPRLIELVINEATDPISPLRDEFNALPYTQMHIALVHAARSQQSSEQSSGPPDPFGLLTEIWRPAQTVDEILEELMHLRITGTRTVASARATRELASLLIEVATSTDRSIPVHIRNAFKQAINLTPGMQQRIQQQSERVLDAPQVEFLSMDATLRLARHLSRGGEMALWETILFNRLRLRGELQAAFIRRVGIDVQNAILTLLEDNQPPQGSAQSPASYLERLLNTRPRANAATAAFENLTRVTDQIIKRPMYASMLMESWWAKLLDRDPRQLRSELYELQLRAGDYGRRLENPAKAGNENATAAINALSMAVIATARGHGAYIRQDLEKVRDTGNQHLLVLVIERTLQQISGHPFPQTPDGLREFAALHSFTITFESTTRQHTQPNIRDLELADRVLELANLGDVEALPAVLQSANDQIARRYETTEGQTNLRLLDSQLATSGFPITFASAINDPSIRPYVVDIVDTLQSFPETAASVTTLVLKYGNTIDPQLLTITAEVIANGSSISQRSLERLQTIAAQSARKLAEVHHEVATQFTTISSMAKTGLGSSKDEKSFAATAALSLQSKGFGRASKLAAMNVSGLASNAFTSAEQLEADPHNVTILLRHLTDLNQLNRWIQEFETVKAGMTKWVNREIPAGSSLRAVYETSLARNLGGSQPQPTRTARATRARATQTPGPLATSAVMAKVTGAMRSAGAWLGLTEDVSPDSHDLHAFSPQSAAAAAAPSSGRTNVDSTSAATTGNTPPPSTTPPHPASTALRDAAATSVPTSSTTSPPSTSPRDHRPPDLTETTSVPGDDAYIPPSIEDLFGLGRTTRTSESDASHRPGESRRLSSEELLAEAAPPDGVAMLPPRFAGRPTGLSRGDITRSPSTSTAQFPDTTSYGNDIPGNSNSSTTTGDLGTPGQS